MTDGWESLRWGEVCELKYGKAVPKQCDCVEHHVPVLGTSGVFGLTCKPLSKGPRVIVGRKGTLGVQLATSDFWTVDTAFWLEESERLDPIWAYYRLKQIDFRNENSGSAVPSLTREHFYSMSLDLPPLAEQRAIARALRAFDDQIEVNRRLIADLEALRRTVSESLLSQATSFAPLSSLARFVNGKNFTKDATGNGRPVIRTPELRQGPNPGTVWNEVDTTSDFVAKTGDVLFVWSGSLMIDRWLYEDGLVNQHIFKVVPEPEIPNWLVYAQIENQMPWFLGLAADKATTMGHIQRGNLDASVPMPSGDSLTRASKVIGPIWDALLELNIEILDLERTRNELLPLLMSGRIRVSERVAA